MDLRNLSATPNQLESVMQRRPSLSSLSSASGYTSSSYGGASSNVNGNTTPQLTNQRLSSTSRNNLNLQNSWLHQQSSSSSNLNMPAANVGPWVEQQQQQQQSTLDSLDNKTIESSLQKDKSSSNSSIPVIADDPKDEDIEDSNDLDDDDELIPTAIVIKNIPFAIKKEQLLDVMTKLNLPLPYAFNYHFDNGVFRGLAFANFTSTDETSMVVNQLNGREIGGRKLRVEYKKMLPLQERERIEREKREKRGQLEEQHRSNSNASLASLLSTASTTAATKNLSVNGATPASTTERLFMTLPLNNNILPAIPSDLNFNDSETLELYSQLILYRDDIPKSIFELAVSPANLNLSQRKVLSALCAFLNLLELFDNGIIIIRRKPGHIVQSIAQQSNLVSQGQQLQQQQQNQPPSHSSSMLNLNQLTMGTPTHPELMRSQSQSALPLPRLRQQASTPIQQHFPQYQQNQQMPPGPPQSISASQQQSRPYSQNQQYNMYQQHQQQQPQQHHQQQPQQPLQQGQVNGTSQQVVTPTMGSNSAAALLRSSNNRSYVDIRATPPLNNSYSQSHGSQQPGSVSDSPTPQHHHIHHQGHHGNSHQHFFQGQGIAPNTQPSTPLSSNDISSRFQPFGQHSHLTGSFTSLQQTASVGQLEEYSNTNTASNAQGSGGANSNERLSNKFTSMSLSNSAYDNSKTGIWGPK